MQLCIYINEQEALLLKRLLNYAKYRAEKYEDKDLIIINKLINYIDNAEERTNKGR